MSRFRLILVAVLAATLVTSGAFAAPSPQGKQQATGKLDIQAAAEKVVREQAAIQAQRRRQDGRGGGGGNGRGGALVANGDDIDEAYEAEVQALTGKRMNVAYTNAPPEIDGVLNDPEWNFADPVTDFMQREPDNGQPGSERTEVRMLYDDDALYFAFYLYDREPDKIFAQDLRRDSKMDTDDTIAVILDTFHDRRNAYAFRVNPLGTKYDVEVRNERQVNAGWDERWDAAVTITDEGWFAEFRIPLSSLRYRTGSHVWGIDFKREIRRNNEEINWSNYRRGFQFNAASQFGNLVGLRDLGLTGRFRFQPYVTGSGSQFNVTDEPFNEAAGGIGVEDFKIQITSNLTADLTFNTDFAQVEDDTERVNLTRFPLFFPEKREFFLESASNFAFGSGGSRRGGSLGMGPSVNLYHSRNIGLVRGEPVPIRYGAKLTGKVGSTNIGFVNAQTGNSEVNIVDDVEVFNAGKNFTVLRLKQDIFERSSVGMIYTNAQGAGEYNRVAGVDASFRFYDYLSISGEIATVVADGVLEASDELDDNPITARFSAGWNSDQWSASGTYQRIDEDFKTDLGFIRRRDVVSHSYRLGWNPRPAFAPAIRQIRFSGSFNHLTDIDGNFLEQSASLSATTNFQSGDKITFYIKQENERLDRIFFVSRKDNIFVLPGDYETRTYWVNFDSFNARTVSGRMSVSWSDYWDGTQYSLRPGGTIRFNRKFSLSPSYSYNHIELPTGIFDTHTITTRVTYNFNERWLTNSLVQYNNVSGRASLYVRLRYVINEIDSFYVVYKSTRTWDEVWNGVADHQLIAKMTYSIDF
ncbi:MAG: carbohydrate binding family 9 domain-containing protein [Acidobacteria bacterium]|nr:carbohydrate binding family 9 domain-containing protein [Acidobacteriota bacterium]